MALTSPPPVAGPASPGVEVLYESLTTRVTRKRLPAGSVICKEPIGADAARRLRHEAAVLARLAGCAGVAALAPGALAPGVLALQDSGGAALADSLRGGPLEPDRLLQLAAALARCVAAMHGAGVLHRDICPANIVLTASGEPLLIDFDLALPDDMEAGDVSSQDSMVGTLAYLPPEQTGRTGRAVDRRSDLYALGATLYELATGRPPFEDTDPLQLIHDHLVREPVPPSERSPRLPTGLSDIILRLLAKAPEQRYQSADGLVHDLLRLRTEVAQGKADTFSLGERDFPARLIPPARLVGRDAELVALQDAFAEALVSPRRTVLVEGVAGVGKSALIEALRPLALAAGGWFVRGNFDQVHRDGAAEGAWAQVLRGIARLLLALPADSLEAQRAAILGALGQGAAVVTGFMPEFELLVGKQPPESGADPRQAEFRLQEAIVTLLAAVVSAARPLVIVMDDLQWAGAGSLRVFDRLMGEPRLRGLLLLGAYRPGSVAAEPALAAMQVRWRSLSQPPACLTLANLTEAGVGELAGRMLRLPPDAAWALGAAVHALTGGNPFDTVEAINALRRAGVLRLDREGWQWEGDAVRRFVGGGSVVDLLTARVQRLPPASLAMLECMACLGKAADPVLLRAAAGLDEAALDQALQPALEDGLLVVPPAGGGAVVQFRHDRVLDAVLEAMAPRVQSQHLALARRLARQSAFEGEAGRQYFACTTLLVDGAERQHAAVLLQGAASQLARTANYEMAERYLAAASALLPKAGDGSASGLRDDIDAARHAALYSLGRLDESDPLYAGLQARAVDPLDLVEPTCLQMRGLDMRGRMEDSMRLGLHVLAQLGMRGPADEADARLEERLDGLGEWIARDGRMDPASRPVMRDPRMLAISKLLGRTVRSALVCHDAKAMLWLLLESQRLWVEHGPCPELVASLGRMGSLLVGRREDYRGAHAICRHVLAVGEAQGWEPQVSEARFVHATYACHWIEPLETMYRHAVQAFEGVRTGADVSYAPYVHIILSTAFFDLAAQLDVYEVRLETGVALCQRTGNLHAAIPHVLIRQVMHALRGQTQGEHSLDDAHFSEADFLARIAGLPYVGKTHGECRGIHALLMGHRAALASATDGIAMGLGNLAGYYLTVHLHFLTAVSRAWQLQDAGGVDAGGCILSALDESMRWLAARAADQPYNYLHLLRVVEAERAWALGDLWQAAAAFDAALLEVETRARPWQRAWIAERAGLFQRSRGLAHAARQLLTRACTLYAAWGATAKVAQMLRDHDFLAYAAPLAATASGAPLARFTPGSNSVSADALELMGVLRASQALSSETSLQRLTMRVTQVLAALTGATGVRMMASVDERWQLLSPEAPEAAMTAEQAAEQGLVPLSVVAYAGRTGEALLLDDAVRDDRFAGDPYFAGAEAWSLLVLPITPQRGGRFLLLLENRLGRAAFNAQRLDAVRLIAGQLAVSLANVQLYESLELRVQARTRELQEIQAQLVATARRAGRAEIANNVLHNVGNVLNSINVSASTLRRTIADSRIDGLARAVDLLNTHAHDLPRFLGQEAQGEALRRYLNELVAALRMERQDALADLDRLSSSVEHITYVVATQQSHAGPSSVLETVRPQEVLEEALRLSEETVLAGATTVIRDWGDLPAVELDKQRLLQILVNLISNAVQAMASLPPEARRLVLSASVAADGGAERLRVAVRDHGEGIAAGSLDRIFSHGFTTRRHGHGFGLHSSSVAAMEMGGKLSAHSDGPGHGATLTVDLPIRPLPSKAH